jgi:carboxylesterase type B
MVVLMSNSKAESNYYRIRFAAPPVGNLRWQAPQSPQMHRDTVRNASTFGAQCPQSQLGGYGNVPSASGSEDCLYLNVYSPPNAKDLPVLVWIHGGGYGLDNGQQDLSKIMAANNNTFIGVAIQYRLGAFGFLSSDEVFRKGVVNAGLLDQHFALQWVQSHIAQFGGNSSRVTVAGESAGAGSVMLQTMAYGGSLGDSLFTNAIAASPFLPKQYGYSDMVPSQSYHAFAAAAGCQPSTAYEYSTSIFECLVSQDSSVLQNASATVSPSGVYGTWAFLPVTDGTFLQDLPSRQLLGKHVNGRNLMVGNNALEGLLFTPQKITTDEELSDWVRNTLPYSSSGDLAKVLYHYPGNDPQTRANVSTVPSGTKN